MKTGSDGVSSAFWLALQGDGINLTDMIELSDGFNNFRWAVSNASVVMSGNTYDPFPGVTPKGYEYDLSLGVGVVDITFANSGLTALLQTFRFDMASMSIFRVFVNSPNMGKLPVWYGKLGDYTYNRNTIGAQGRTRWNGLTPNWPFFNYGDNCSWRFGSAGCGFNTSSVTVTGLTISTASGAAINIPSLTGSGYYDRGRCIFSSGLNSGEIRAIKSQSASVLDLSHRLPYAISSGDTVSIWPGCRKRLDIDCASKFNNSSAYLGFKWIPKQERAY